MSEIRGIDILVSVKVAEEYVSVAGQRGATLNRSASTIDVSNKVSGDWAKAISGMKSWSVDADGLLPLDDAGFTALETAFNTSAKVLIQIAKGTDLIYSGEAYITDFPIEAPYDDVATYSVSFAGNGELTVA